MRFFDFAVGDGNQVLRVALRFDDQRFAASEKIERHCARLAPDGFGQCQAGFEPGDDVRCHKGILGCKLPGLTVDEGNAALLEGDCHIRLGRKCPLHRRVDHEERPGCCLDLVFHMIAEIGRMGDLA
jgi:hypothetical protein